MTTESIGPYEVRLLSVSESAARLAVTVPGLRHSVLVQLLSLKFGRRTSRSLYAVYREGTMTFDAIVRFGAAAPGTTLGVELRRFVQREEFRTLVVAPLGAEVRSHFGRR